jgi:aminoglycoside 6'-N-acetyltransferase I
MQELQNEAQALLNDPQAAVFLWEQDGAAAAFAQCGLRHDYVEGTRSSPVGYLEGVFVDPKLSRRGIARALVQACEAWARRQGCSEFASDCEISNRDSLLFHLGVGFEEAGRIICFVKPL